MALIKKMEWAWILVALFTLPSCMSAYRKSLGGDPDQSFNRVFLTDFPTAWQAALDSLKNSRLDISNREGGFIQTKWVDNTAEKNFKDSFGLADAYIKAQYRFRVTVSKNTTYQGKPTTQVTVQKEQLIQRDVLEGWRPIETDSIDENTLLYRISRLISIRIKLLRMEEQKTKKALENPGF